MKFLNKNVFSITKLILFVLFALLFYFQVKNIDFSQLFQISVKHFFYFIIAFCLLPVNLFFEFKKWDLVLKIIEPFSALKIRFYSFFSGVVSAFLTPNLIGNFIGRMFYFERKSRIPIVFLTSVSNLSQLFISIFLGSLSVLLLPSLPFLANINIFWLTILSLILCFIFLFVYFNFEKFPFILINKKKWFLKCRILLKNNISLRYKFLLYSFFRFLVFSVQYSFFIQSFGIDLSLKILLIVWSVYFWSSFIPSLWFGKLIIRESLALWLFSYYGYTSEVILSAALCIWICNQLVPTLFFIPFLKIKKNNV